MANTEQKFDTFQAFLKELEKRGVVEDPTLIIPEHGPVLTSTLTLEQCFVYLTDKTLQSAGTFRLDDDVYIIQLEERSNQSPFLLTSRTRAISQEIKERCYQMKLDRAIAEGAGYYLCHFRQVDHNMEVTFVSPEVFSGGDVHAANKRAGELEQERYKENDYNLRIVARLARSREDAKAGIFIDN